MLEVTAAIFAILLEETPRRGSRLEAVLERAVDLL
jgi:hypothetical protein